MSSNSRSGLDVLGITSPPRILDGIDDVTTYLDASGHATEELDCLRFYRHQLGDRPAPLCDDDRPALLGHLVHQAQTVGLEVGCGNVPVVHKLLSIGHLNLTI